MGGYVEKQSIVGGDVTQKELRALVDLVKSALCITIKRA